MLQEVVDQVRQHPRLVIADDYELCVQRVTSHSRQFHNGEQCAQLSEDQVWLGLRIIHRKRPGRSFSMQATPEAIGGLVEAAFDSAQSASVDPWFRFPLWKLRQAEERGLEGEGELVVPDSLYPELQSFPDILEEKYEAAIVHTELHRKTERFHLKDRRETHGLQFSLMSRSETGLFRMKEDRAWGRPLHERQAWLDNFLAHALALRSAKPAPTGGQTSVLLAPRVAAALLRRMAPWFCADQVHQGRSPLCASKGTPLFSGVLSLVDDGCFPGAPLAAPFDMEGSVTQQTLLVERGCLRDLLYDTYWATRENRLSTGNFLRPPEGLGPRVGASTLYFRPSAEPRDSLVRWMQEGIVLETLDSLEPVPGTETEWWVRGSGWRVVDGALQEAWSQISLQVDLLSVFKQAVGVGNDLEFHGTCGSPSILFEDLPLGI